MRKVKENYKYQTIKKLVETNGNIYLFYKSSNRNVTGAITKQVCEK